MNKKTIKDPRFLKEINYVKEKVQEELKNNHSRRKQFAEKKFLLLSAEICERLQIQKTTQMAMKRRHLKILADKKIKILLGKILTRVIKTSKKQK